MLTNVVDLLTDHIAIKLLSLLSPSFFLGPSCSLGKIISFKLWLECHLAGHKHSVFGMNFVFSEVAAVYIAFREMAEAHLVFLRAACCRNGDEATEKCWLNDANSSCFDCFIFYFFSWFISTLQFESALHKRKKWSCKHVLVNGWIVFVAEGTSLFSLHKKLHILHRMS